MKQTKDELARIYGDVEKRWRETLKEEKKSRPSDTYPSVRLIHDGYTLAVGAYLLENNIAAFVEKVNLVLQTIAKLYQRHEAGEVIDLVRDWPFQHEFFFYALCINDLDFATELANKCDPEQLQPTEQQHPFNEEFTYALRLLLLDNNTEAKAWIDKFEKRCQHKKNAMYAGYAAAFRAISDKDPKALDKALQKMVDDYPRQSKSGEFFHHVHKALLCFYGVGMIHLARHHGLSVSFDHPLIPKALSDLPPHVYVPPKTGLFNTLLKGS
ncbi:hypothetical protein FKG94_06480 [Exilibacterium tricleocarpae]|uniref:Tetratricopeptide repeat protein n=1 Tax=Exilibacterium tricleocarpae TaxID=2591008 RepID=A0A545U4A8_9GAMM|nr:hypothetical protein [Exilibacterium tricleocarpae]TQV84298.1 hypothetical protein FKG94_06480 [Exilibacterium tricleocarpae]